ncbi:MAG: aspartate 1-decarboxylase [Acidobacteriota bacterium]|nr:aspartate 1-decarboxylase [Acidobacteriota bacterium]
MFRTMLKSKLHGATVTQTELYYEGSITIDAELMLAADLLEGELVQVVNLNNGARIETYVIQGDPGSGVICLNGPAARTAAVGDVIHVLGYGMYEDVEARSVQPKIAILGPGNRIMEQK